MGMWNLIYFYFYRSAWQLDAQNAKVTTRAMLDAAAAGRADNLVWNNV